MTTYFVSGFMRSGTSMMMAALEAGGLEVSRNVRRDKLVKRHADKFYSPNRQGLYELHRSEYKKIGFPEDHKGKLIKLLFGGINRIAAIDDFKIVFMRRDPEEMRQSYEAFFPGKFKKPMDKVVQELEISRNILLQRRDVELVELWYRDVVANPVKAFEELEANDWPIDSAVAAATVDPKQLRFKREDLALGV